MGEVGARLGHPSVWSCAACLGQMSMPAKTAEQAGALSGLDEVEVRTL